MAVSGRYFVTDVGAAVAFYSEHLGLAVELHAAPGFAMLARDLRAAGVEFRNDIVEGQGGKQILVEDPSGNPVELFE